MSKGISNLISIIAGLLVGTFIGVFFAPDTGSNTRDKLSYRLERTKNRLESFLQSLKSKNNYYPAGTAKQDSEKVVNDARSKARTLLTDVDKLLNQMNK